MLVLTSCKRSVAPTQLEGSWQWHGGGAQITWAYLKDHTWVMGVSGATNAALTGSWKLDGHRLTTTTRSSTLSDMAAPKEEVVEIQELDGSTLVVDSPDARGGSRVLTLQRLDGSDGALARKLLGAWIVWSTNASSGTLISGTRTFREDGTALWDLVIHTQSRTQAVTMQSEWRVDGGVLSETPTNATSQSIRLNKESRDQVVFVTDSQFVYRDDDGKVHLNMKQ